MDTATQVKILDEAACISHRTKNLEKGLNPTILRSVIGKQFARLVSLPLV